MGRRRPNPVRIGVVAALLLLCTAARATAPLKFHPGHYVSLNHHDAPENVLPALAAIPGVRGVQIRYPWRRLEPSPEVYDLSSLATDLALARRHGLQLVAFIEDKTFFTDAHHLPDDLASLALPFQRGGRVAKRWDPVVVARLGALLEAIGARFDDDPAFEGIALQESAMGFSRAIERRHGYTPERYRDALKAILRAARAALPTSQVFWYMNFLEGRQAYLADVAETAVSERVAMGGPDVLPDRPSLVRLTYPLYARFSGRLTLFCSIQNDSYAHRRTSGEGYWSLPELLRFARDDLGVSYLFWNRKDWRKPPDSWSWPDAVAAISAAPDLLGSRGGPPHPDRGEKP